MQSLCSHCIRFIHPRRRSLATLHGALVPRALLPFATRSRQFYGAGGEES